MTFSRARALEHVASSARGILFVHDHLAGQVEFLNARASELLGHAPGPREPFALVRSWVLPEDQVRLDALPELLSVTEVGESLETQLSLRHQGGAVLRMRGTHLLLEKRGRDAAVSLVTLEDETQTYRLFESLERKAHELESLLQALPDASFRIDRNRVVTRCFPGRWNPEPWEPLQARGRSIDQVLPPSTLDQLRGPLERAFREREAFALEHVFPDRPSASFEARFIPFLRDEVMLLLRDLSDRARSERALLEQRAQTVEASKLAAMGRMAAGLAHEINSPLAVICSGAEFLMEELRRPGPLDREPLAEEAYVLHSTGLRIAQLVKGLQAFDPQAGRRPLAPTPVRAFVGKAVSFCEQQAKSRGVTLEVPPLTEELQVVTRGAEAAQILLCLLANACDAVEHLPQKWVRLEVAQTPDAVALSVTDSGPGVPAPIRDQLFTPFFTTKDVGKGMGLGLAVSRQLAESHGGTLALDERSPHTRFVLTLRRPEASQDEEAS